MGNLGNLGIMINQTNKLKSGYEYLAAYKLTVAIEDLVVEFSRRCASSNYPNFPNLPSYRSHNQWIQAARSGSRNIPEGAKQQGLKGYIKLAGVSRGSLEELLKDSLTYARQHRFTVFPKDKSNSQILEINKIWKIIRATPTLPDHPDFPALPDDPEKAINLLIALINQANYLIDKLIISLLAKHKKEGGLTEKLYQNRKKYRGY